METWYLPKGGDEWLPGQCLLTAKPGWIGGLVEDNDGAFWAPALLDDRNMLYSVPSPFNDEGGTSFLAWIRWEFARKDCRTSNTGRPDRMLHSCTGNGEKLSSSQAEPGLAINSAVA